MDVSLYAVNEVVGRRSAVLLNLLTGWTCTASQTVCRVHREGWQIEEISSELQWHGGKNSLLVAMGSEVVMDK